MLKKLNLNGRTLPVPVPIQTVGEALTWVCECLLKPDEVITKIVKDEKEITESFCQNDPTTDQTKLEIRADSPSELSAQSLDALCNLCTVMFRGLKPLAVSCWQTIPTEVLPETITLQDDLQLIVELAQNCITLIPDSIDIRQLTDLSQRLKGHHDTLRTCFGTRDWKQYARILLNRLEPTLRDLIDHASSLQAAVFSDISEKALQRV